MTDKISDPSYLPPGADIDMPAGQPTTPDATWGFVLIDKPRGLTSQGVVSKVRRRFGLKKVGHAGTLDPLATGLLIIGVGKATRLLTYLVGSDKSYIATIRIGVGTVSDDAEGDIIDAPPLPDTFTPKVATRLIDDALQGFVGVIEQVPSRVSAKKIDGKRAYDLVRQGKDVQLEPRTVTITRCERIGSVHFSTTDEGAHVCDVAIAVDCSSGTYIRAIARDLGNKLGTAAHVTALRRTHVNSFSVSMAHDLEELRDQGLQLLENPLAITRRLMPSVELTIDQACDITYGKSIDAPTSLPSSALFALVLTCGTEAGDDDDNKLLVGIGKIDGGRVSPSIVLANKDQVFQHVGKHATIESTKTNEGEK